MNTLPWLAVAVIASAEGRVAGTVTDPDSRAVVGARVEIVCGDARVTTTTDAQGAFALEAPGAPPCAVSVRFAGFADTERVLSATPFPPLQVRLRLQGHREVVSVRAFRQGPAGAAATPAGGASLSLERLAVAGPDVARWLSLADRAAGQPLGARDIRVNGLEATAPPSVATITAIRVADDPFSAEASGADRYQVDITTEAPRRWQYSLSPGLLTAGHRDTLMREASHDAERRSAAAGGPLMRAGRLRVTASWSDASTRDVPAYLDPTTGVLSTSLTSSARTRGASLGLEGSVGLLTAQTTLTATDVRIANGGVGGTAGPSTAMTISTSSWESQSTWRRRSPRVVIRGGLSIRHERQSADALATGRGSILGGQLIRGAPDVTGLSQRTSRWHARTVAESAAGTPADWLIGVDATSGVTDATRTFNPDGVAIFASAAAARSAELRREGPVALSSGEAALAVFGQRTLWSTDTIWLRVGARTDWQRHLGTAVSPRLSFGARAGGWLVATNAGIFTDPWSMAAAVERAFRQAAPPLTVTADGRVWPVAMTGAPARRVDAVARVSLIRPMGPAVLAVEQTWKRGRHLPGLVRSEAQGELTDTLVTSRASTRWITHLRADVTRSGWTATAHYEFANAYDDSDGPFAWPASQRDLAAEWGPSPGVPRHAVTFVAGGMLGYGVQAMFSARRASGLPYSLQTGLDPDGVFTFSGRIGASRNLARAAGSSDLSAYISRSYGLPFGGLTIDLGVRLENMGDVVSPLEVDRRSFAPTAGGVVSASPGRAASLWATVGRR